jgi:hypothetical protein
MHKGNVEKLANAINFECELAKKCLVQMRMNWQAINWECNKCEYAIAQKNKYSEAYLNRSEPYPQLCLSLHIIWHPF